jgi:hypothetical protein
VTAVSLLGISEVISMRYICNPGKPTTHRLANARAGFTYHTHIVTRHGNNHFLIQYSYSACIPIRTITDGASFVKFLPIKGEEDR